MKSKFKCFYESLLSEAATGEEAKKMDQAIADIRATYGEAAGTEIESLVEIVHKYAKKLAALKESKVINKPKKPEIPTRSSYKSESAYEKALQNHPLKLKQYHDKLKVYFKELTKLNQEKLDEISGIANDASKYNIPKDGTCQLEYVLGNSKVGDDTIIINMGPATSCDSAKAGECELYNLGFCYAQQNESQHKLAITKRFREQLQWRTDGTGSIIASQLAAAITQKRKGVHYIKYVRFNESGDFKTKDDKTKLGVVVEETNKLLKKNKEEPVVFYTYTHRSDLFPTQKNDIDSSPSLVIQGSGFFKDSQKKGLKTPFYVDNCFMGLDYPNLLDLVQNGNFDQITQPETDEEEGKLGIDFEGETPKVVICRGACFGCQFCKTKNAKLMILVVYHGSGTKIKSASMGVTKLLQAMRDKIDDFVDLNGLPPEIKRELYNINHFNEYLIADKLIGYARSKNQKGPKIPLITWESIVPFMLDLRELIKADQEESIAKWGKSGKKSGFKPKIYNVGTRFPSVNALSNYVANAQKSEPKETEESYNRFNSVLNKFIVTEAAPMVEDMPALKDMSIQEIYNLAVANKLATHKDYINPQVIQDMLNENQIDIDVMGDGLGEEPEELDGYDEQL